MKKQKTSYRYRSAKTGYFVTEKYAKRYPKTTIREKVNGPRKPVKKKQKYPKPCGHDFHKANKNKCGICGKRRAARVSGKPSWAGGYKSDSGPVRRNYDTSYTPPWHKRKSFFEN